MSHGSYAPALLALALAAALPACRGGSAEEAGEHEHPSVVVTQWNDSTELFLEYPHLLVGQQTGNWAIHLTNRKDYTPLTAGALTVRFLQGGRPAEVFTLEKPARNGIYLLDPVVRRPGTYQVRLELNGPQVRSLHVLPEVVVWEDEAKLPHAEEEEEAGGAISFLKEQQWVIPFRVEAAAEAEVARSVSAPAEVVPVDGAQAVVSAPASGIADAAANRTAPSVGDFVRAGQVLAVLSPTAEEGGYARTRGELERLQREAARAERLFAAGAIPRKRLEDAQQALRVARAEAGASGGGPDADYRYRVRAPISGTVTERRFVPGGRVAAGEPLFTLVDPRTLWLRVRLPAAEAGGLPQGARARFTLEGGSQSFATTRLVSVGGAVDPQTRTVPVVFAVENAGGALKVGQFGRASVPVGGSARGVAIPASAILDDNGQPVAFVQTGGESFERRRLRLGESDGARTVVLEGVRPGEMVVTEGSYQVRLASMSNTPMSGGHAH